MITVGVGAWRVQMVLTYMAAFADPKPVTICPEGVMVAGTVLPFLHTAASRVGGLDGFCALSKVAAIAMALFTMRSDRGSLSLGADEIGNAKSLVLQDLLGDIMVTPVPIGPILPLAAHIRKKMVLMSSQRAG